MPAVPIPEPTVGLVIGGIRITAVGTRKLWGTYVDHREMGKLLQASLARAICEEKRNAPEVKALARKIEAAMRKSGRPREKKSGRLGRVKSLAGRIVPKRTRPRRRVEPPIFGPSLAEHLQSWLSKTADAGDFADEIVAIDCGKSAATPDLVVARFPGVFEDELFSEGEATSEFRKDLAGQLLNVMGQREQLARWKAARNRAIGTGAAAAVPATVAFAAAEALGASDPTAGALAISAAALGAAASTIAGARADEMNAAQGVARGMVLCWISGLLERITGKRLRADPELLQAALYPLLGDAVHGRLRWPTELARADAEVRNLSEAAARAGDQVLARELTELERLFEQAVASSGAHRTALAQLYGVIAACESPAPPASSPETGASRQPP